MDNQIGKKTITTEREYLENMFSLFKKQTSLISCLSIQYQKSEGVSLSIPMPGHTITGKDLLLLDEAIIQTLEGSGRRS